MTNPWAELEVDVVAQEVRIGDRPPVRFRLDPFVRRCLVDGVDELGFLLSHADAIVAF